MSKISIKLVIAGRSYPLTINESEEEAVRKAAEDINSNIQQLQQIYAVKDMQDLLAMTSLQLATRSQSGANPQKEREIELKVRKHYNLNIPKELTEEIKVKEQIVIDGEE